MIAKLAYSFLYVLRNLNVFKHFFKTRPEVFFKLRRGIDFGKIVDKKKGAMVKHSRKILRGCDF